MFFAYGSFENTMHCTLIGFSFKNSKILERKIKRAKRDGWQYDGVFRPLTIVNHLPSYINVIY